MQIDKVAIGNRVKSIRINLGLTAEAFGKEVDSENPAAQSLVSRWERGVNLPNRERMKTIAELADVTVVDLIYGIPLHKQKQSSCEADSRDIAMLEEELRHTRNVNDHLNNCVDKLVEQRDQVNGAINLYVRGKRKEGVTLDSIRSIMGHSW